jgi:phosphoserine phosphatase
MSQLPDAVAGVAMAAAPHPLPIRSVSVLIPALNEARRIAQVVRFALADPVTAEVVVVDDSSVDDTARLAAAAGARVVTSTMLGKGPSMADALREAAHEIVLYLDGDLAGLRPGLVAEMVRPLLEDRADFVKARFGRGGGRVTELTAKPMLRVFFPEIAHFAQPLGGIVAARRALLQQLPFEDGYGVDVGLLIDAWRAGARLAEVDIGRIENDSQPLLDLAVMANEVARVIHARARAGGRFHVEQITAMYEQQRQAAATLEYVLTRRRGRRRLLLLDMDGTLTTTRFAVELARASGQTDALAALLDAPADDAATRSARIAGLFRFVHQSRFEQVARAAPLRAGAVEFVNRMRRAGFMVGVVSDSWFVAADIVRRRVFADFALAHTVQFDGEVCSGQVRINPAFEPLHPGQGEPVCKSHVLARMRAQEDGGAADAAAVGEASGSAGEAGAPPWQLVWAVGDNLNDLALLRAADRGFAIDPKHPALRGDPRIEVVSGFEALLAQVPMPDLPPGGVTAPPSPAP